MAVYIDPLRNWGGGKGYRWDKSCHMYADTLEELHELAERIGMWREWFQSDRRLPHYDLHRKQREKALALGVVEHTRRQMTDFMKQQRGQEITDAVDQTIFADLEAQMEAGVPAVAYNAPMDGMPPPGTPGTITLETLMMEGFKQVEEMRLRDETLKREFAAILAVNQHIFAAAPPMVQYAAFRLSNPFCGPMHPNEYKTATEIITNYLEEKVNGSASQHSA